MPPRKEISHLRLVSKEEGAPQSTPIAQGDLFPVGKINTLVFVYTPPLGDTFIILLNDIRPRLLFDLRPAPRFDIFGQSRRETFKFFDERRIQYVDVAGILKINTYNTVEMNAAFLASSITKSFSIENKFPTGPIIFLLDDLNYLKHVVAFLPTHLRPPARKRWEVVQITQTYRR